MSPWGAQAYRLGAWPSLFAASQWVNCRNQLYHLNKYQAHSGANFRNLARHLHLVGSLKQYGAITLPPRLRRIQYNLA